MNTPPLITKTKRHYSRWYKAPKEMRRSQVRAACNIFHRKGFDLYYNERTTNLAVRSSGHMFEFSRISARIAQAFCTWLETNGRTALPSGVQVYPIAKPRISPPKPRITPVRATSGRASFAIEGSYSTVPGHYVDLGWSDLRK